MIKASEIISIIEKNLSRDLMGKINYCDIERLTEQFLELISLEKSKENK